MHRTRTRPIYSSSVSTSSSSNNGGGGTPEVIIIEKQNISGIATDNDFYLTAGIPQTIATTLSNWVRITINSSIISNSPRGSIVLSKNPETGEINYTDNSIREVYVIVSSQKNHLSIINRIKEKKILAKFLFEWDGMNLNIILNSESDEYNGVYHVIVSTNL